VMLGGFLMMKRRMLQVFCNLFVVSCSFLRHQNFLRLNDRLPDRSIDQRGRSSRCSNGGTGPTARRSGGVLPLVGPSEG
jgi:hypothetical protein